MLSVSYPYFIGIRDVITFLAHHRHLCRKLFLLPEVVNIEKKRFVIDRVSARTIATGQIRGTPRSHLIEQRGASLDDVVEKVTAALTRIGGADPYRGSAQAVMVEARLSA